MIWSLIKWLAMRIAPLRWLFKIAGMAIFVPIALLLKTIGLPLLLILGVLALPILFFLFLFGLPIFLVLAAGGAIIGLLFAILSVGLVAIKIALVVVLPIWLIWKIVSWIFCRRKNGGTDTRPDTGPDAA